MINARTLVSGRYYVERVLARGGMAEVWLAHDQLLDRPVALKVLFPELSRDPSFVERFRREAQAAANLMHPNIVGIYDWGQENGDHYIVMEYVDGKTLRELMRTEGPLAPERAAGIGMEIATALAFAHERGVVHRDIKPGNVLITPDGRVKVTDFGIARAGTSEALTQTGSVMGTATYFSPEQAQGLVVDGRSDLYSLGIVLYEAVVGSPPFVNDNPLTVAFQHVRDEPVPPSEHNAAIPRAFDTVVMVSLQKDPARRYQSGEDVRAELERFRAGAPLFAPAPAKAPVTAAVTTTGTGGGTGSGRVFGAASTTVTPASADGTVLPPPYAGRRRGRGPAVAIVTLLVILGAAIAALLLSSISTGGGTPKVVVADVSNATVDVATATLRTLGFDVADPVLETNATVPEGKVIATNPVAGTRAKRGTVVTLRVSDGLAKALVPDLSNRTIDEADKILRDAGFELVGVDEANDFLPPGTIYKQVPAAGARADKGSKVTVTYAKPSDVPVPNVINLDQTDAFKQLTDAGFTVRPVAEQNATVAAQRVIRTDPAPNAKVPKGSTVTMVVSSGPETADVPNVVNQTQAAATSTLQDAGFEVSVQNAPSTPANAGRVISQTPASGKAAKGSTVTITVGQNAASTTTSRP